MAILACEIALGVASLVICGALVVNRSLATAPTIAVRATVERVGFVGGPKASGWSADFIIDGKSWHPMISAEVAQAARASHEIVLTLQPGRLGHRCSVGVGTHAKESLSSCFRRCRSMMFGTSVCASPVRLGRCWPGCRCKRLRVTHEGGRRLRAWRCIVDTTHDGGVGKKDFTTP